MLATVAVAVNFACFARTSPPSTTPTPALPVVAALEDTVAVQAMRKLAFDYWEAFNSYDADKTISYLEDGYRSQRESVVRGEIGRIKLFGVKLGVSEESAPVFTNPNPGEGRMFLRMKEPLGARRILMAFRKVGDNWRITYAEEVK